MQNFSLTGMELKAIKASSLERAQEIVSDSLQFYFVRLDNAIRDCKIDLSEYAGLYKGAISKADSIKKELFFSKAKIPA